MQSEKMPKDDLQQLLAEVNLVERQVAAGHYIRHEDMKDWLSSWGKPHELLPPRCICGEGHDEDFCP